MSGSFPPLQGLPSTASSVVDVLLADEEIEDVGTLTGSQVPGWLHRLGTPQGWQLVELSGKPHVPLARMAVYGQRDDGGWEAAETISVFGYTGWAQFYEIFHNAAGTLRALDAASIVTKVLPVPPVQWTVAVRSSGTAVIGGRDMWAQQSNYVTGSEQPHAGRLIVHSIFVEATSRARLAGDISQLNDAVYQGFVATLSNESRTG
jgi:hypothetical protein